MHRNGVAFKSLSNYLRLPRRIGSEWCSWRTEWDRRSTRYFVSHHAHDGYYKRALRKLTTWPRSQLQQSRKWGNRTECGGGHTHQTDELINHGGHRWVLESSSDNRLHMHVLTNGLLYVDDQPETHVGQMNGDFRWIATGPTRRRTGEETPIDRVTGETRAHFDWPQCDTAEV